MLRRWADALKETPDPDSGRSILLPAAGLGLLLILLVTVPVLVDAGRHCLHNLDLGIFAAFVGVLSAAILLPLMLRFGLLAMAGAYLMANLLMQIPITTNTSAPYFGTSFLGFAATLLLAGFAFYAALAGRALFGDSLLPEGGSSPSYSNR